MRVGLAAGPTAGQSFRSGEFSSSGPPAGSKLNQASAGLNGRGRPFLPMNRLRKHRSLSASMAAREAVLNHIGSASGAYPCSCASHLRRCLLPCPSPSNNLLVVASDSLSLRSRAFSGFLRLGLGLPLFVAFLIFFFLAAAPLSLVSSVFVGLGRTAKRRLFCFGLGVAAATQWTGCPLPRHVGG